MLHKKLIVALGFVLLATSLQASAKGNIYKISFHISQSGSPSASPTLVVKEGTPATIETSGENGYSLAVTANDAGQGKVKVSLTYISAKDSSAPILIVKEGQEASISQGSTEIKLVATRRKLSEPHSN